MEEILSVKGITKRFEDITVFENLSLTVKKGEVVVIVGPSGCGKSTFLRCLNALEDIQEGEITLESQPGFGSAFTVFLPWRLNLPTLTESAMKTEIQEYARGGVSRNTGVHSLHVASDGADRERSQSDVFHSQKR